MELSLDKTETEKYLEPLDSDWTEIAFILDKSGSMAEIEKEAREGFNAFLAAQAKREDYARLTTVLFNNEFYFYSVCQDIRKVAPLTETTYVPDALTALLDALGGTMDAIAASLAKLPPERRARRVIIVTLTDGLENASQKYKLEPVKARIELLKKLGWEFLFLGANIDGIDTGTETGTSYGFSATHTATAHKGPQGMSVAMDSINKCMNSYRSGNTHTYHRNLSMNKAWGGAKAETGNPPEDDPFKIISENH